MVYFCSECKEPITLLQENGQPLYHRSEIINKSWAIVKRFCSPKCSLDEHETNAGGNARKA